MSGPPPYVLAQQAIAGLKGAVYSLLAGSSEGLRNAEIGRLLGIHTGHVRHEGHIPRTLLALMEAEGVVEQDVDTKKWRLRNLEDLRRKHVANED